MSKFDYNRVRETFVAPSTLSPPLKRSYISDKINDYLDSFGDDNWEMIHYTELLIDEGTVHLTAVFKKEMPTPKKKRFL